MTCHVCGDTGIETFDDTNAQGHLCTSSRPCTRCARHARRRYLIRTYGPLLMLAAGLALSWWGGLQR